jgi:hypothetical protein
MAPGMRKAHSIHSEGHAAGQVRGGGATFLIDPSLADRCAERSCAGQRNSPLVDRPALAAKVMAGMHAVIPTKEIAHGSLHKRKPPGRGGPGGSLRRVRPASGGARGTIRPGRWLGLEASRSVGFGAADARPARRTRAVKAVRRAEARPAPAGRSGAAAHR